MRSPVLILALTTSMVLAEGCSPLHLIYARATTEPPTSVDAKVGTNGYWKAFEVAANNSTTKGFGAAGWELVTELTKSIPGATSYAVHYPANMDLASGISNGTADMMDEIQTKSKACPKQKYVLSGHSQGAALIYMAVPKMPKDMIDRLAAVTTFGSPPCRPAVKDICMSYCNAGDVMCEGEGILKSAGGWPTLEKLASGTMSPLSLIGSLGGLLKGIGGLSGRSMKVDPEPCSESVPEKGHKATVEGNAHMVYGRDGYYIKAAVCFIQRQFKKSGGQ